MSVNLRACSLCSLLFLLAACEQQVEHAGEVLDSYANGYRWAQRRVENGLKARCGPMEGGTIDEIMAMKGCADFVNEYAEQIKASNRLERVRRAATSTKHLFDPCEMADVSADYQQSCFDDITEAEDSVPYWE